jgi:hypothetical protein
LEETSCHLYTKGSGDLFKKIGAPFKLHPSFL